MARIVQNLAYLGVSVVGAGDHAVVVKDAHPAMMTRNLWERAYTVRNEEAVTVAQEVVTNDRADAAPRHRALDQLEKQGHE